MTHEFLAADHSDVQAQRNAEHIANAIFKDISPSGFTNKAEVTKLLSSYQVSENSVDRVIENVNLDLTESPNAQLNNLVLTHSFYGRDYVPEEHIVNLINNNDKTIDEVEFPNLFRPRLEPHF